MAIFLFKRVERIIASLQPDLLRWDKRRKQYVIQEPLTLKDIDQPNLQATKWSTRNNPYVEVTQARSNSPKRIYLDTRAPSLGRGRTIAAGTYTSGGNEPPVSPGVTLEQRGNVLRIQQARSPRYRDEGNRQRRDTKARRYRQYLSLVNRTYGRVSDVQEVVTAWNYSGNLSDFVETLAINEAIDRKFAAYSEARKRVIYQPLRIGGTPLALRHIWKLSR